VRFAVLGHDFFAFSFIKASWLTEAWILMVGNGERETAGDGCSATLLPGEVGEKLVCML